LFVAVRFVSEKIRKINILQKSILFIYFWGLREERSVRTLGRDHTVWYGRVWHFGTVVLKVGIWFGLHICDPRHDDRTMTMTPVRASGINFKRDHVHERLSSVQLMDQAVSRSGSGQIIQAKMEHL
jgi:hypothetical protein